MMRYFTQKNDHFFKEVMLENFYVGHFYVGGWFLTIEVLSYKEFELKSEFLPNQ